MVVLASSILISLLAASAEAQLRHDRHQFMHRRHVSPSPLYGSGNSTALAPTGTGALNSTTTVQSTTTSTSTSTSTVFVTVSPLPAGTAGPPGQPGQPEQPNEGGNQAAACAPATVTVTAPGNTVTVTVPAVNAPSSTPPSSSAAAAAGKPSEPSADHQASEHQQNNPINAPAPEHKGPKPVDEGKKGPTAEKPHAEAAAKPEPKHETPSQPRPETPKPATPKKEKAPENKVETKPPVTNKVATGTVGKRGIVFNDAANVGHFTPGAQWAWNWGSSSPGLQGVEFVPTMQKPSDGPNMASHAGDAKFVKCLNEPDMSIANGGTAVAPAQAASLFKQYLSPLAAKGAKLGTPSVTSYNVELSQFTNGPSGLKYLKAFKNACSDCPIGFVDLHWYGEAGKSGKEQAGYFLDYVKSAIKEVDSIFGPDVPVWFSEFSALPTSEQAPEVNKEFIENVFAALDSNPRVQRYSYFSATNMCNGGNLNAAGQAFVAAK